MTYHIAIGTGSFAMENQKPLHLLKSHDISLTFNQMGRRLNETETIELLKNADGLIAGLEPLNRHVLKSAPKLKAIARIGIGMDTVDVQAAQELGIKVSNTPDPPTEAVAEVTVGAMLSLCRRIVETNSRMHQGQWKKTLGLGLNGTRVLIIGCGRNGRRVASLLAPFCATLFVCDPYLDDASLPENCTRVSLCEGLKNAQVITLHASGTDTILDQKAFGMIADGAFVLNSARGELIEENALVDALDSGKIAGAWLDVFTEEPYRGPLVGNPRVILSPHNATFTRQCRLRMEEEAVRNLLRDLGVDA